MSIKQLIAAVAVFAAAGSAFADVSGTFADYTNIASTRTRAEVVAELAAQGPATRTEWAEPIPVAAKSDRTREEVRAQMFEHAKTHQANDIYKFGG